VTIGGGEPLMQADSVTQLLQACQNRHLHTAVETTGFGSRRNLAEVLEHVDLVYFDLKHMYSARHKELTGVPNEPILENIRAVVSGDRHYQAIIRVTTIPGLNDSEENIFASARFAVEPGCDGIELVPYHKLGAAKYAQYGMEYRLWDLDAPSKERMQELSVPFWEGGTPHLQVTPSGGLRYAGCHDHVPTRRPYRLSAPLPFCVHHQVPQTGPARRACRGFERSRSTDLPEQRH
jgi:pyruvate-formate lyase-activating enzyme